MDRPALTMGEKSVDHRAKARQHNDAHQSGARRHWSTLGAIETLFGRPVAQALRDEVEGVNENASEAAYHYEEALKEVDHWADLHVDAIRRHLQVEAALREKISLLVADATARYKRSRRPLPAWIADLGTPF